MGMTEREKCWVHGAEKEFAVGVCALCSMSGRRVQKVLGGGGGGGGAVSYAS